MNQGQTWKGAFFGAIVVAAFVLVLVVIESQRPQTEVPEVQARAENQTPTDNHGALDESAPSIPVTEEVATSKSDGSAGHAAKQPPATTEKEESRAPESQPADSQPAKSDDRDSPPHAIIKLPEPNEKPAVEVDPAYDATRRTTEELKADTRSALVQNDKNKLLNAYRELQSRGDAGIATAFTLLRSIERKYGLAEVSTDWKHPAWKSAQEYFSLFTRELAEYAIAWRGDGSIEQEVWSMWFLQFLVLMDDWPEDERVELAGKYLLSDDEGEAADWRRHGSIVCLQDLFCAEAARLVREYLKAPRGFAMTRYDSMWVLAREGGDENYAIVERFRDNDEDKDVRGTARYLLLARGRSGTGLLVTDLEPGKTAANASVLVGDVITKVDGEAVRYQRDLPPVEGKPWTLTILRDGAEIEVRLLPGEHGIQGAGIPPAFRR